MDSSKYETMLSCSVPGKCCQPVSFKNKTQTCGLGGKILKQALGLIFMHKLVSLATLTCQTMWR